MDRSELRLANGDVYRVKGGVEEIEKTLSDAARSGQSRLAWFVEHDAEGPLGVNPAQVAALKRVES